MRAMARDPAPPPDTLDVDIAAVMDPPADNPPSPPPLTVTGAPPIAGREPAPVRSVPARGKREREREKTSLALDRGSVTAPSTVSAPLDTHLPARFALSAGTVATRAGPQGPAASGTNLGPGQPDPADERDVNIPARLLSSSPLAYPQAARQAGIEIDFPVEIVVEANGRVTATRALSRVGYGLDEAALRAIRGYRFSPALSAGRPVRVRMRWTVQFRLR